MQGRGRGRGKAAAPPAPSAGRRAEAEAENGRGNALFQQKSYRPAVERYERAFELDDTNVQYLLNAAAALFELEEYMSCIKVCQKAIMLGYKLSADRQLLKKAFIRVGRARLKQGRVADARKYFDSLVDCGLAAHETAALEEFRSQVSQLEAALAQGLQPTRFQMLRPRARLFTPFGCSPTSIAAHLPPFPSPHPELLPLHSERIAVLTLGVSAPGFMRHSLVALAEHLATAKAVQEVQMHVVYDTDDIIAREILFACLSLQLGRYQEEADASPDAQCGAARMAMLLVFLEHSLALPPLLRRLLDSALDWLWRTAGSLKAWTAARIEGLQGSGGVPLPITFPSEATLAAVREVWRGWLEAPAPDVMAVLQEVVDAGDGAVDAPSVAVPAEGENLLTDLLYQARAGLDLADLPAAAADARSGGGSGTAQEAEVLHWHRFRTLPVPAALSPALRFGEVEADLSATARKAGGPVPRLLLTSPALSPPARLTQWAFNPLFLTPLPPVLAVAARPPARYAYRPPPFDRRPPPGDGSLLEHWMELAGRWGRRCWRSATEPPRVVWHLYQSRCAGLEAACAIAQAHSCPHVVAPPLEHAPPPEAGPPPGGIAFDVIDATAATPGNSLLALLLLLPPMLRPTPASCLLTAAPPPARLEEPLKYLENLLGANPNMLHKIFQVQLDSKAEGPLCWRPDTMTTAEAVSLHDTEDFRQLFWRVLQHVLLPQQYSDGDSVAQLYPVTETTGILLGLFDAVHRQRFLPGPGFVESLLNDTFFQGVTTSQHIRLSLQVLCRQYLATLHENVVAAPAQCLPLCPLVHHQATFTLLNDPIQEAHKLDAMPLAVVLVYEAAQTGPWYRLREDDLAAWLVANKGAVHVLDVLELLSLDGHDLAIAFHLPQSETAKRAGKQLMVVHWERRVFLSQPCPLERVTTADRKGKGRKKKRGKKKKEGAGGLEDAADAESGEDEG